MTQSSNFLLEIKNNAWFISIFERVFSLGFKFLLYIYVSRVLGSETQGVFGLFNSYAGIILLFSTLGLELSNNYFSSLSDNLNKLGAHLGNTLVFSIISPFILFTLIIIINHAFNLIQLDLKLVTLLFVTSFINIARQLIRGYIYGLGLFYQQFVGVVLSDLFSVFFLCGLLFFRTVDLFTILVVQCAFLLLSFLYWIRLILNKCHSKISISKDLFVESFLRGLKIFSSNFMLGLSLRLNFFIVAYYYKQFNLLGYYTIAISISEILLNLPLSLTNVVLNKTRSNAIAVSNFLKVANSFLIILVIIFFSFSYYFVPLVFGDEFQNSLIPLFFLLVGSYFYSSGSILSYFFMAKDENRFTIFSSIIMLITMLIVSFFLVPRFNIIGGALSTMISYISFSFCQSFFYRYSEKKNVFSFSPDFKLFFLHIKRYI